MRNPVLTLDGESIVMSAESGNFRFSIHMTEQEAYNLQLQLKDLRKLVIERRIIRGQVALNNGS